MSPRGVRGRALLPPEGSVSSEPMASRQRAHGGGSFASEKQRRAMWANAGSAARKWAHNVSAAKDPSWRGMRHTSRMRGLTRRG